MSECFSARCQHDRKIARREFHKWNKNILFQIGLETIAKNHFEFDINLLFHQTDDRTTPPLPIDFNPDESCLFCVNRQEYAARQIPTTTKANAKNRHLNISTMWFNDEQEEILDEYMDTDENAPLDLSLKTTTSTSSLTMKNTSAYESLLASANRSNVKQRSFADVKSDILPPMFTQDELDRVMDDIVTGRIDLPSQTFANMNLFANDSDHHPQYTPLPSISNPYVYHQHQSKKKTTSQDARIAQLAKQMAYNRLIQEVDYQRHSSLGTKKKSTNSKHTSKRSSSSLSCINTPPYTPPSAINSLSSSADVNQILNDVMMRMVYEMFEEQTKKFHQQQQQQQLVPTPPTSKVIRKGEVLFVKKKNVNIDEQYNSSILNHFLKTNNNSTKKQLKRNNKINPSSSSASSTSSTSSTSTHTKDSHKIKSNYVLTRREEANNNNHSKIIIGQDGKQIRPKRGQYRRYESEQLAKAVAAVLSNEMSVHKAGSFFGVPHSTLEYKVKERNIKVTSTIKTKGTNGENSSLAVDSQESSHHHPLLSVSPSISSISINDNNNNNNIPETKSFSQDYDGNDDDDDDNSAKSLAAFLPPSNSSRNHHHRDSDSENESEQDEGEEDEFQSFAPIELEIH